MRKTTQRRATATLAIVAGVALAATACSGAADDAESADGVATGTLTIANSATLTDFDPVNAVDAQQIVYYQAVYDSLMRTEPDGTLTPMLATDWTYDDSLTELTLTLRADVTFSNGEPFDADAVVANLEHQMAATTSLIASAVSAVTSVAAEDEDTVVIGLSTPDPGLLEALGTNIGLMAAPETLEDGSAATTPIGTGPYVLDAANTVNGDTYAYTARSGYWDPELQKYGTVQIKYMEDLTARLNAIQAGQVDAAVLDLTQYDAAEAAGLQVQTARTQFSGILIADRDGTIVPALGDVRVRQAIAYAIDREALVSAILGGRGAATSQNFAEDSAAFVPALDSAYAYDADEAKALMSEAGYADGFEVTMPDMSAIFGADVYAALIDQLKAINITVTLDSAPIAELLQKLNAGAYAISFAQGQMASSWYVVSTFYTPGALYNQLHTTTPEIEALIDDIRTTTGDEQAAAYQALNQYVVDNAWIATAFRSDQIYASTEAVDVELQAGHVVPYLYNYSPAA